MPVVSDGLVVVVVVADGLVVVVSVVPESDVPEPDVLLPELSDGVFSQTGALEPGAPDVLPLESGELDGTVMPEPPLSVVPDDPAPELSGVVLSVPDAPEDDVPDVLLSDAPPELPASGSDKVVPLVPVVPLEVSDGLLPYPGVAGVGVPVLPLLPVPDDGSVVDPDVSPEVPLVP